MTTLFPVLQYFSTMLNIPPPQVDVWAPLGPDWAGWQDFFNDVIADFFAEEEDDGIYIEKDTRVCIV